MIVLVDNYYNIGVQINYSVLVHNINIIKEFGKKDFRMFNKNISS